jgi:hypothetical protein
MRKIITMFSLVGLVFALAPASASAQMGSSPGFGLGSKGRMHMFFNENGGMIRDQDRGTDQSLSGNGNKLGLNNFILAGNVVAVTNGSLTVRVLNGHNISGLTNAEQTILTDSSTKIVIPTEPNPTLNMIAVGDQVWVYGSKDNSTLKATIIKDFRNMAHIKFIGNVAGKTDSSLTVNDGQGKTMTFAVDANTNIGAQGTTKTLADINLGQKIWVHYKQLANNVFAALKIRVK